MKKNKNFMYALGIALFAIALSVFNSCETQENFEYPESGVTAELGVTAWKFIQGNDSLQLLTKAIKRANLQSFYQDSVNKTFIAPTNEAFSEYLQINSYTSLNEVPVPILRNALKYHIVNDTVDFTNPDLIKSNNPIAYKTKNGQNMYLSHNSNFQGIINEGTNKQFTIVTSNLRPTNGVLHVVPSVVYFSALSKNPDEPDPSVQTDTIFPVADTYINGGNQSGVNFGSETLLKVKNVTGDGSYDRKTYLLFDLKDFDQEGVITDLKLELAVSYTAAKGVSLDLYSTQDTLWEENELNFDNATLPENAPIASLSTSQVNTFDFNITDFYNGLDSKRKISLILDGEEGTDETDEFASKENTEFAKPMLVATIGSGNNNLELVTNTGFQVKQGSTFVFNDDVLKVEGAAPENIIFTVENAPEHGYLVKGTENLKSGDQFTQEDIGLMNVIYINDGTGTTDEIGLSGKDRSGSQLDAFTVKATIN